MLRRAVPGQAPPRRGPGARRHRTATSSSSAPATARCSAATRSWSRRRPRRSSPTSSARRIHESAKAICTEAGYYGAGTVEYLVGADGSISFLEVNTRLQVEHPVSEETAGIDLVRQQFRIADGEQLAITEDPTPRGHSIEFRINAEDAGRDFMPAPGPVTRLEIPQGPGVRWDSGVETGGEVVGGRSTPCWPS